MLSCKLFCDPCPKLARIILRDLELLGERATHAIGQVFSAQRKRRGIHRINDLVTILAPFRALGLRT